MLEHIDDYLLHTEPALHRYAIEDELDDIQTGNINNNTHDTPLDVTRDAQDQHVGDIMSESGCTVSI